MAAVPLGEARWWHAPDASVRSHFVVIEPPSLDLFARLVQILEPVLLQTLIAEAAIQALDVAVLHGPPWLDQDVSNTVSLSPADEGPAAELWSVVCPDSRRVASEPCSLRNFLRLRTARLASVCSRYTRL